MVRYSTQEGAQVPQAAQTGLAYGAFNRMDFKCWALHPGSTPWLACTPSMSASHAPSWHMLPLASMTSSAVPQPQPQPQGVESAGFTIQTWLQDNLLKLPFLAGLRESRDKQRVEQDTAAAVIQEFCDEQASQPGVPQQAEQSVRHRGQHAPSTAQVHAAQASLGIGGGTPPQLTQEDRVLWEAFLEIDANDDGFIDFVELRQALDKLGLPCTPDYLVGLMRDFDSNKDSFIDWNEFRGYVKLRESEIQKAFKAFDVNGDGVISACELQQVLYAAGIPAREEDVKKMVDRLDTGAHDGVIDYNEFRRFAAFLPSSSGNMLESPMMFAALWHGSTPFTSQAKASTLQTQRSQHFPWALVLDIFVRISGATALVIVMVLLVKDS